MRAALQAVLILIMLALLGWFGAGPRDSEGLGVMDIWTDKCSYGLGEPVRITFANLGNASIVWPETGARWRVPHEILADNGTLVFVTMQPAMTIPSALGPGETYTTEWNQTTLGAPGTRDGTQIGPGWYRIHAEGRTPDLTSNLTASDDAWFAIAAPCPNTSIVADAGPDVTIREGKPATLVGTARGGAIAPGNWTLRANLSEERMDLAAVSLGGQVYAIGGNLCDEGCEGLATDAVEAYDPVDNVTRRKAPLPAPRSGPAAATVDGDIHAIGGYVNRTIGVVGWHEEYDPATDVWTMRGPMPTPRAAAAATIIDGQVYVVGGTDGGTALGELEVYDPATDEWTRNAPMPTPRFRLAAVSWGGKLYAIGGFSLSAGPLPTVEMYDPAPDTWSTAAPLPKGGRRGPPRRRLLRRGRRQWIRLRRLPPRLRIRPRHKPLDPPARPTGDPQVLRARRNGRHAVHRRRHPRVDVRERGLHRGPGNRPAAAVRVGPESPRRRRRGRQLHERRGRDRGHRRGDVRRRRRVCRDPHGLGRRGEPRHGLSDGYDPEHASRRGLRGDGPEECRGLGAARGGPEMEPRDGHN